MGSMMDELVHCMAAPSHSFLCDLAASSGESDAASLGWQELRGQLKSGQLYGNELLRGSAATNWNVGVQRT